MKQTYLLTLMLLAFGLAGCKYYGSALPPEYPLSMDDAADIANDKTAAAGGAARPVVKQPYRPRIEQPAYLPEKELALVSPPQTLLLWNYPHITEDNQRIFGSWSTIFIEDRYRWVAPANALPADEVIRAPQAFPPSSWQGMPGTP